MFTPEDSKITLLWTFQGLLSPKMIIVKPGGCVGCATGLADCNLGHYTTDVLRPIAKLVAAMCSESSGRTASFVKPWRPSSRLLAFGMVCLAQHTSSIDQIALVRHYMT